METILSKEIQLGLDKVRLAGLKKLSRLRIKADGAQHEVLRMWKTGFALDAGQAPHLRGLVDIYDGTNHMFQCLIVASDEEAGEMRFEFKRATPVTDAAPLDFVRAENAPVALIGSDGY